MPAKKPHRHKKRQPKCGRSLPLADRTRFAEPGWHWLRHRLAAGGDVVAGSRELQRRFATPPEARAA